MPKMTFYSLVSKNLQVVIVQIYIRHNAKKKKIIRNNRIDALLHYFYEKIIPRYMLFGLFSKIIKYRKNRLLYRAG